VIGLWKGHGITFCAETANLGNYDFNLDAICQESPIESGQDSKQQFQGHLSSFFYTFLQETPSLLFIYRMTVTLREMSPVCDIFSPVMFLKPNIFSPCWQVMGAVYFLEGKKLFFSTWWPNLFKRTSHFGSFSASLHSLSW
jgi:hypothetical protein